MDKENLIKKWLNDELTDQEKIVYGLDDDFELNQRIVDNAKYFKASQFSKASDYETLKLRLSQKKQVKFSSWLTPMMKIASLVVIGLALFYVVFNNNNVQVETLVSEKITTKLPDESEVYLNAMSSIEYDKKSWQKDRNVKLIGEAYFKVKKGKTFTVSTQDGSVSVVGTEFIVKQRDNYFEVKCYEGKVEVISNSFIKQLGPGEMFRYYKGRYMNEPTVFNERNWNINNSVFYALPIKEVISELERQYDIKVQFINADTNRLFSGGFTHDNLNDALMSITKPMNMTYELHSSNKVIIHGEEK